jgi:hypothetical protein
VFVSHCTVVPLLLVLLPVSAQWLLLLLLPLLACAHARAARLYFGGMAARYASTDAFNSMKLCCTCSSGSNNGKCRPENKCSASAEHLAEIAAWHAWTSIHLH